MSDAMLGTCELCKHWDADARRKSQAWRIKHPDVQTVYESGECREFRDKVEIDVRGDGYVELVETEADFGCVLFAPLEGAT